MTKYIYFNFKVLYSFKILPYKVILIENKLILSEPKSKKELNLSSLYFSTSFYFHYYKWISNCDTQICFLLIIKGKHKVASIRGVIVYSRKQDDYVSNSEHMALKVRD